ncbi:MAG: hypothetical protein GC162_02830 [Planctomycetes bacterium]|nr:hypothetical protein [Planctomycetota bacterium]
MSATLFELADALIAGAITPGQRTALESMLEADDAAKKQFVQYLDIHAQLHWELRTAVAPAAARLSKRPAHNRVAPESSRRWYAAAAIVLLTISLGLYAWLTSTGGSAGPVAKHEAPATTALITDMSGAQWDEASQPVLGESLDDSVRTLRAGTVQLMLASRAVVTVEGPARFRIDGENHAHLDYGRLSAWVPEPARGFTLAAPGFEVIDRGTEFGVWIDPASPATGQVHVFAGRVDVQFDAAHPSMKLTAGQAVRVNGAAAAMTSIDVNPGLFGRLATPTTTLPPPAERLAFNPLNMTARRAMNQRRRDLVMALSFDFDNDADEAGEHAGRAVGEVTYASDVPPVIGAGRSLKLDGRSAAEYVTIDHTPDLAGEAMTLSLWIKSDPAMQPTARNNLGYAHIVSKLGGGGNGNAGWALTQSEMTSGVYVRNDSTAMFNQCLVRTPDVLDDQWHHLAIVWRTDRIELYVDGRRAASQTLLRGEGIDGGHALVIGAQNTAGARPFAGLLDEVTLFRSALNDKAIAELARGVPPAAVPIDHESQTEQRDNP